MDIQDCEITLSVKKLLISSGSIQEHHTDNELQ